MNAVLSCYRAVVKNESSEGRHLVPRFINTVTFADGAYEARSRREEEVAPRSGLRRAPSKCHRIYKARHFVLQFGKMNG